MLRAANRFYEEFPVAALRSNFVVYAMNGTLLFRSHGYPVRAIIPGHWREVHVKWLTEIEVLRWERKGHWEKRGWHGTRAVPTVAKLWTVQPSEVTVLAGGPAFAGTRGIRRVEVSINGVETWNEATLGPALGDFATWRQWKYEWTPTTDGATRVIVRAVDGTGTLQPRKRSLPDPAGATGWVARRITL